MYIVDFVILNINEFITMIKEFNINFTEKEISIDLS